MKANEYYSPLEELPALANAPRFAIHRSMFIGCGGLGFETVNLLKKRMVHYFEENELDRLEAIRFLSIDTADHQLQETESILDPVRESLRVDLTNWRDLLQIHPGVREWFPSLNSLPREIRKTIQRQFPSASQGCGTTRVFGRLGMFKDDLASELKDRVKAFVRSVPMEQIGFRVGEKRGNAPVVDPNDLYFYVISTLGGGTGTGLFMDVAAIIRRLQEELGLPQTWHIYGIFVTPTLLTRNEPRGGIEKLNANSYAALKEVMHFLDGAPFRASYDMSGSQALSVSGEDMATSLFNVAFLIDGESQSGKQLQDRLQIASFVSGMLFKLALTYAGEQHFQSHIDTAMSSVFDRRLPRLGKGLMIKPQRPSFASFGWATVHIPLEELIHLSQLHALDEVLESLSIASGKEGEEGILPSRINEYFITPKKGAEEERFIDEVGLTALFHPSFWNNQARSPVAGGDNRFVEPETGHSDLYRFDYFDGLQQKEDPDQKIRELLDGKKSGVLVFAQDEIMSERGGGEKPFRDLAKQFAMTYLGCDSLDPTASEPVADSRLSRAVTRAQGQGGAFVLKGLKRLLELLAELEGRTNQRLSELEGKTNTLMRRRDDAHDELTDVDGRLMVSLQWVLGRQGEMGGAIEEFVWINHRYKRFRFQKSVLAQIVSTILPLYREQLRNWYTKTLHVVSKTQEMMPIPDRMIEKQKASIGKNAGSDFNIHVTSSMMDQFYAQFKEIVHVKGIIEETRGPFFRVDDEPDKLNYFQALSVLTSQEIVDQILERIRSGTRKAAQSSRKGSRSIFRLDFDNFTSTEDNDIFWDHDGAGDIQSIHSKLERSGEFMTRLRETSGASRVFNISDSDLWRSRMSGTHLPGLYPHKSTHLEILLGFAPFQLHYVKEWYKDYKRLLDRGVPLHVFKEAESWDEPYTYYSYPKSGHDLFQAAAEQDFGGLIYPAEDEKDCYRVNKKEVRIERFTGNHCLFKIRDSRRDIISELDDNERLYVELCNDLIKVLRVQRDHEKMAELVDNGAIPNKIKRGLDLDISNCTLKNPVLLFDMSHEKGLIERFDQNTDLYMLKTKYCPIDCDCSIEDSYQNIVNELNVNEVFYELICRGILRYILLPDDNDDEKRRLLRKIVPFLPPHLKEGLEGE